MFSVVRSGPPQEEGLAGRDRRHAAHPGWSQRATLALLRGLIYLLRMWLSVQRGVGWFCGRCQMPGAKLNDSGSGSAVELEA